MENNFLCVEKVILHQRVYFQCAILRRRRRHQRRRRRRRLCNRSKVRQQKPEMRQKTTTAGLRKLVRLRQDWLALGKIRPCPDSVIQAEVKFNAEVSYLVDLSLEKMMKKSYDKIGQLEF